MNKNKFSRFIATRFYTTRSVPRTEIVPCISCKHFSHADGKCNNSRPSIDYIRGVNRRVDAAVARSDAALCGPDARYFEYMNYNLVMLDNLKSDADGAKHTISLAWIISLPLMYYYDVSMLWLSVPALATIINAQTIFHYREQLRDYVPSAKPK